MKRHQIKRVICNTVSTVSDAQIRQAIADLGFPTEDGHDYDAEQVRQIIAQFNRPAGAGEPPAPPQSTDASAALTLTRQTIAASTNSLQSQALSFANRIQEGDRQLARQVAGFLANRPNQFAIMLSEEIQALMGSPETVDFIDVELATMPSLELPSVGDSAAALALGMAR